MSRLLHVVVPLVGVVVAGSLSGCGTTDEGARSTLAPVQPTSYITVDPPTTTTTTVPPPPPTAPSGSVVAQEEQTYTVQRNDNLFKIATKFGITLEQLTGYNGITNDHLLIPGQTTLRIPKGAASVDGPGVSTGTPSGSTPATGTSGGGGSGCVHVVVSGDYQGKVANQYGVSLDALAAANANNPAWNVFRLGDEIIIPAGGNC